MAQQPNPERPGHERNPASAKKLLTADKQARAIELRKAGLTYPQIAREMGIPTSTAYQAVMRQLKLASEKRAESAIQLRELMKQRLELLFASVLSQSGIGRVKRTSEGNVVFDEKGQAVPDDISLDHVHQLLRIIERIGKIYGLEAPTKIEVSVEIMDSFAVRMAHLVMDFIPESKLPSLLDRVRREVVKLRPPDKRPLNEP